MKCWKMLQISLFSRLLIVEPSVCRCAFGWPTNKEENIQAYEYCRIQSPQDSRRTTPLNIIGINKNKKYALIFRAIICHLCSFTLGSVALAYLAVMISRL